MSAYYYSADLPWTISEEEQERYRRLLKRIFIFFLIFGIVMPFLPVPTIEREAMEEVPPRLAKLILERQEAPPPAPPVKAPEPEPQAVQAKPAPKKPEPKPVVQNCRDGAQKG